ncbi:STAS domain-containing protein [Pleionea sp. CnH1-48]|uniref:STAS domain-containing protein n=1 Tax=Pleionea sp. CnH1-48 TaxID=2954494 RepID=UPI002097F47A|nr:STAS domain-containing protein [Pleionea sp. CnH1-48]MCO7226113.1 STAS domain-containing protein [Pleionea sp. CnH1-48]
MGITSSLSNSELTIKISGKFDFSAHQDFRNIYEGVAPKPSTYVIDMTETTYLDSSALGMLLLLRDYAGGTNGTISLRNCNTEIKKILAISNFEQLFTIN